MNKFYSKEMILDRAEKQALLFCSWLNSGRGGQVRVPEGGSHPLLWWWPDPCALIPPIASSLVTSSWGSSCLQCPSWGALTVGPTLTRDSPLSGLGFPQCPGPSLLITVGGWDGYLRPGPQTALQPPQGPAFVLSRVPGTSLRTNCSDG